MVRMHGPGKGISSSSLPFRRTPPSWLKHTSRDIIKMIVSEAKKGVPPSMIGTKLRDQYGIAQVKNVTGRKILRLLKHNGQAPDLPEDMYCLIKRAVNMRKHLEKNRRDIDTKFRLILVESRIHRLARYYKQVKALPPTWKYEAANGPSLIAS